jgi:hypothetical protein
MWNAARRKPAFGSSAPSVARLCLGLAPARRTLLDGGWWPRSADPVAELPGLIRAMDDRRGRVTLLMLGPAGWDSQPRWLGDARRAVPLDWYRGQPAGLLTAFFGDDRMDLLVVPPGTAEADAIGAMDLATQAVSVIRVPDILATLTRPAQPAGTGKLDLSIWAAGGGRLAGHADADQMTAIDAAREPAQVLAEASLLDSARRARQHRRS